MKREFLMLADIYDPKKYTPTGWFLSEKLDGCRAFWDGGISRGIKSKDVPWANVLKDERYKEEIISTGLWSRYGKVIHAPDWFLDCMPDFPLDGELWIKRGGFQALRSIISTLIPSEEWKDVKFYTFDTPKYIDVFHDSNINTVNYKKQFRDCMDWIRDKIKKECKYDEFEFRYKWLKNQNLKIGVLEQTQLPFSTRQAEEIVNEKLFEICSNSGEGLILRHPFSVWEPRRVITLLKVKQLLDDEGTVIGYTWGREGKLIGKMGALIVDWKGKRFELSGFTDDERRMTSEEGDDVAYNTGCDYPGKEIINGFWNSSFEIGSKVTFKYRELSDTGIPREARYARKT